MRSSLLELLVWGLYMSFPYLYNPPQWMSFWSREVPVSELLRTAGVISIAIGLVTAFGTMFWFGLRRTFKNYVQLASSDWRGAHGRESWRRPAVGR